jgi:tetratricopeptide (TPR) repeat protein
MPNRPPWSRCARRPFRPHPTVAVRRVLATLTLLGLLLGSMAHAQAFSAERYLQECLRFEAGGDHGTARQSCLNALQAQPGMVAAELALGRIEIELGDLGAARTRLTRIRRQVESPEPTVLLAEIAFRSQSYEEAADLVATAQTELARDVNLELSARVAFLDAALAAREGRYEEALRAFDRAVVLDGLNVRYRLADAQLRFRLGDSAGALEQLLHYVRISGDALNPDVTSLQGRLHWAEGALGPATDHIEQALALRSLRDSAGQSDDLRVLAVLYYAQGDLHSGGIALREAMRRGNLLTDLASNSMMWLLALVVLLGFHLVGESRHAGLQTGLPVQQPAAAPPASVGQAYGILIASALAGLAVALIYSAVVYHNVFALVTPLQQHEARAVYFVAFALVASGLAWRQTRRAGVDPIERLLGTTNHLALGLLVGIAIVVVVIAFLAFTDRSGIFGSFFLDLSRPTAFTVVALALIPLSELYFRGILYPSLAHRYDANLAVVVAGLVWAIAFGTPVILLAVVGIVLTQLYRQRRSGLMVLSALLVGWVGLLIASVLSPAVRSLFFA